MYNYIFFNHCPLCTGVEVSKYNDPMEKKNYNDPCRFDASSTQGKGKAPRSYNLLSSHDFAGKNIDYPTTYLHAVFEGYKNIR